MSKQLTMVIDLHNCVGCGACAIACKTENNTQNRANGQSFNWADFQHEASGTFPNVKHTPRPVMCNHCTDAKCVEVCPTEPKAMYKSEDGVTLHNSDRCIGCMECMIACPYSAEQVDVGQWSVISYNEGLKDTHQFYRNTAALIPGCTATGELMSRRAGAIPPHKTSYTHPDYDDVRREEVVEKCNFCHHRTQNGLLPACVDACPAGARIFGDVNDPSSDVAKVLNKYEATVLKPEAGTKPNVHYVRSFKAES